MASALAGSDPVVFFESQRIYDQVEISTRKRRARRVLPPRPSANRDIQREGTDVTV